MRLSGTMTWLCVKIDRLIVVSFGVCGGLALAQFPQYLVQYLQRLGGHIDEARYAAGLFALPELSARADRLAEGFSAIEGTSAFFRAPVFFLHAQWGVARETLRHYAPGMTFTVEEVCYLAAGALVGVIIYGLLKLLLRLVFRASARGEAAKGGGSIAGLE